MNQRAAGDGSLFPVDVMNAVPGGDALWSCLQCGACGGSCPSGSEMDHTPRSLLAMIQAGLREPVLQSNTPWYCVSCYYCWVRCPQGIPIPELMYALKRMSIREGAQAHGDAPDFSRTFVANVERYGRSYELGLAARYHLTHHQRELRDVAPAGFELLRRHRVGFRPEKINGLAGFRAILRRARSMGDTG
jgi:heterodisulfide reductase subunit C